MKTEIEKIMRATYFKYTLNSLGIEPAPKETPEEGYNEWMRKMGNVHYSNHEAMIRGYEIVKKCNK
jgi:hypothetical protein